jgi:hypothetical protein
MSAFMRQSLLDFTAAQPKVRRPEVPSDLPGSSPPRQSDESSDDDAEAAGSDEGGPPKAMGKGFGNGNTDKPKRKRKVKPKSPSPEPWLVSSDPKHLEGIEGPDPRDDMGGRHFLHNPELLDWASEHDPYDSDRIKAGLAPGDFDEVPHWGSTSGADTDDEYSPPSPEAEPFLIEDPSAPTEPSSWEAPLKQVYVGRATRPKVTKINGQWVHERTRDDRGERLYHLAYDSKPVQSFTGVSMAESVRAPIKQFNAEQRVLEKHEMWHQIVEDPTSIYEKILKGLKTVDYKWCKLSLLKTNKKAIDDGRPLNRLSGYIQISFSTTVNGNKVLFLRLSVCITQWYGLLLVS